MTRTFTYTKRGKEFVVPARRDAPRFGKSPIGCREFTKDANRTARRGAKASLKSRATA